MHLNSAALSNYLFWNVSLCKSTKEQEFRENIATAESSRSVCRVSAALGQAGISKSPPGRNASNLLPLPRLGMDWVCQGDSKTVSK